MRRRTSERGLTAVEVAVVFAIVGSVLAVAVPAFVREVHASRFVEPVDGLQRIGAGALSYAADARSFPPSAPLTPAVPPRGVREADPPGAWDHPTWKALGFRAAPDGVPHAFAFAFDSAAPPPGARASSTGTLPGSELVGAAPPARSTFVAHAHADLDGDGVRSTFEIRGHVADGEPAAVEPGMYVEAEVE